MTVGTEKPAEKAADGMEPSAGTVWWERLTIRHWRTLDGHFEARWDLVDGEFTWLVTKDGMTLGTSLIREKALELAGSDYKLIWNIP